MALLPMLSGTTTEAPAFNAPTFALPAGEPFKVKSTVVAAEAAVPMFWTVAFNVIAFASFGEAGVQSNAVMTRTGFGAHVPKIWNSATCPAGAPVLAVKFNWTALATAETGMVTVLAFVEG